MVLRPGVTVMAALIDSTLGVTALAFAWVAVGFVTALTMRRRGHNLAAWAALGMLLGPFTVPLAIERRRGAPGHPWTRIRPGVSGGGPVHVIVGVDGSPECEAAVVAAVELLGPRLGRLTLATVVDHDTAASPEAGRIDREEAASCLRHAAALLPPGIRPEHAMLTGAAMPALLEHARAGGYHLVAIGCRGRGRAKALVGSVASRLARGTPTPVLMAGCAEVEKRKAVGQAGATTRR